MNRFEDLLEALQQDSGNKGLLDALKALDNVPVTKGREKAHTLRMPYSSEPAPLEPAWD